MSLRLAYSRSVPPPNPTRDAEMKHIKEAIRWLRVRVVIAERDILQLEKRQEALETEIEQEWQRCWG